MIRTTVDTCAVSQDLSLLSFSRRLLSFFDNRLGFPFLGRPLLGIIRFLVIEWLTGSAQHLAEFARVQCDSAETLNRAPYLSIRSHDYTAGALFSCEPDNHAIRLLSQTGVNDANSIAFLLNFVDRPRSPAIKDNRDVMAFILAITGEMLH